MQVDQPKLSPALINKLNELGPYSPRERTIKQDKEIVTLN